MLRLFIYLLLSLICFDALSKIKVGVTSWRDFTNPDETGIYFDVLREVYQEPLEFEFLSFNRMIGQFERGRYDIIVGVYKEDVKTGNFSKWHLDYAYPIIGYYLKQHNDFEHISDLNGKVVSWVNGYHFERYVNYPHDQYVVSSATDGFKLLLNRRIDVFVDYPINVSVEQQKGLGSIEIQPSRPTYLAFQSNVKGKRLARLYDEKIEQLKASGRLKEIYGKEYEFGQFHRIKKDRPEIVINSADATLLRTQQAGGDDSLEAKLVKIIIEQMSDFDFKFQKTDYTSHKSATGNQCYSDKISTPERRRKFLLSKPMSLYAGIRLFSDHPILIEEPASLTELLIAQDLTLGIAPGIKYNSRLQREIQQLPAKYKVRASEDTFHSLRQIKSKRFDVKLEYPAAVTAYWNRANDVGFYSYAIKNAEPFTLGHMLCAYSDEGKVFIKALNDTLSKLYQREYFYDAQFGFASGMTRKQFESYYNRAFLGKN